MAATAADSLTVHLGLDDREVSDALKKVDEALRGALKPIADLEEAFREGVTEAAEEAAGSVTDLEAAAVQASAELARMGEAGHEALAELGDTAWEAEQPFFTLNNLTKALGRSLTDMVKNFASRFSPFEMISSGDAIRNFINELEELDKLSGKRALSLEELARKQELLAEYSKEDLDLYYKTRPAMESLEQAYKTVGNTIARILLPGIAFVAEKMDVFFRSLKGNESFVIAFFAGLAAVMTTRLNPALWKMAAAWLANPLTWIIVALGALALLFNDLWIYLKGGKSALVDFWADVGLGPETIGEVTAAFETLKEIGGAVWDALKDQARSFVDYFGPVLKPLVKIVLDILKLIKALFTGSFEDIGSIITSLFTNVLDALKNLFLGFVRSVVGWITRVGSKIPGVGHKIKDLGTSIDGWFADSQALSFASGSQPGVKAADTVPVQYSEEVLTQIDQIFVQTMATDANGIASGIFNALKLAHERQVESQNSGNN